MTEFQLESITLYTIDNVIHMVNHIVKIFNRIAAPLMVVMHDHIDAFKTYDICDRYCLMLPHCMDKNTVLLVFEVFCNVEQIWGSGKFILVSYAWFLLHMKALAQLAEVHSNNKLPHSTRLYIITYLCDFHASKNKPVNEAWVVPISMYPCHDWQAQGILTSPSHKAFNTDSD